MRKQLWLECVVDVVNVGPRVWLSPLRSLVAPLKPSWWERDISQSTIWAQGMFSKEVKATTREEKGTGGVSLSIDFACNLLLKTAFSLVTLFKTF